MPASIDNDDISGPSSNEGNGGGGGRLPGGDGSPGSGGGGGLPGRGGSGGGGLPGRGGGGLPPGGGAPRLRVREIKPDVARFKNGSAPGIEEYEKLGYCTGETLAGFLQTPRSDTTLREYHLLVTSVSPTGSRDNHQLDESIGEQGSRLFSSKKEHREEDFMVISMSDKNGNQIEKCGNLSHIEKNTFLSDSNKNYRSLKSRGRAINAPPLFFVEGERAKIVVHNRSKASMTIHWHGIFLDTKMDGIPGFQIPIAPGENFTYEFDLVQNGTYWYHPHDLNEQDTKGSMIVFAAPKGQLVKGPNGVKQMSPGEWITYQSSQSKYNTSYNHDRMIMMTDYKDQSPLKILQVLQNNQDPYMFDSGYSRGFFEQPQCREEYFQNFKTMKMFWMDPADVWYDYFLLNDESCLSCGPWKNQVNVVREEFSNQHFPLLNEFSQFTEGDRIRLRLINSSASSYFHVNFGNSETITDPKQKLDMLVVAKDGQAVEPIYFDSLYMGMGETYDVIVDIPNGKTLYELNIKSIDDYDPHKNSDGSIKRETRRLARVLLGDSRSTTMDDIKVVKAYDQSITLCGPKRPDEDTHSEVDYTKLKRRSPPIINPIPTTIVSEVERSTKNTYQDPIALPPYLGDRYFQSLYLAGNMTDYYWQIKPDNDSQHNSKKVGFKYFEMGKHKLMPYMELANSRYNFIQITNSMMDGMMNHPWHMHGLYFKMLKPEDLLLNDSAIDKLIQEKPLLHTATIKPGEVRTIVFYAANEYRGAWMFHCHNLYHMASDMMMFVKYDNYDFRELNLPLKYGDKKGQVIGLRDDVLHGHRRNHSGKHGNDENQIIQIQDFILDSLGIQGGFVTGGASFLGGVDPTNGSSLSVMDANAKARMNCKKGGQCFAEIITGVTNQNLSGKEMSFYVNGRLCSEKKCATISYTYETEQSGIKSHRALVGGSYRVFNSEILVLNAAVGAVCKTDPLNPHSRSTNGCMPAGDTNVMAQITNGKIGAFNQLIPQSKVVYRGQLIVGCKEDELRNNGNICANFYGSIKAEALVNRNLKIVGFCRVSTGTTDSQCLAGISIQLDPIYKFGASH